MKKRFEDQKEAFEEVCKEFKVPDKYWGIVTDKLIGLWNKNKFTAKPYPDTIDFLKEMKEKGMKLILVSNTDNFSVDFVLDKFELKQYFDVIALSCDVGYLKTDPEMFDKVLKEAGLKKEEVIMVGDSFETDIKGAEKAGIKPVLIDRRGRREYENKIQNLAELKQFL